VSDRPGASDRAEPSRPAVPQSRRRAAAKRANRPVVRREIRRPRRSGVFVLALAAAGCAAEDVGAPAYPLAGCGRLDIVDDATGEALIGVEDFALGPDGAVWISAYDRRGEDRGRRLAGAIGRLAMDAPAPGRVMLDRDHALVPDGGVHLPHGIDVASGAGTATLVYVNRRYDEAGRRETTVVRVDARSDEARREPLRRSAAPAPRNVNDVLASDPVLYTVDRGSPSWWFDLTGGADGRVIELGPRGEPIEVVRGLSFANGLARVGDDVLVAETRGRRLARVDLAAKSVTRRMPLPGGPDNLTRNTDGFVVAALHPSLWKLALHRKLGAQHAPSRAVRIDPETGAWTLLFDDPNGAVFSGATVAAETDGKLVLGSATDRGLLVCERRSS